MTAVTGPASDDGSRRASRTRSSRPRRSGRCSGEPSWSPPATSPSRTASARVSSAAGAWAARRVVEHHHEAGGIDAVLEQVLDAPDERVHAGDPGLADDHDRGRGGDRGAGERVAVLDIGGADVVVALEVGVDVGHDDPVGAPQARQRGLGGAGPDGGPVAVAAQPEEQLVAAVGDVEGERADVVDGRLPEAVGVDELGEPGHHVAGVVEDGLVGVEGEVGQQGDAGVAGVVAEPLGQGGGDGGGAGAGHAGDGDEVALPPAARRTARATGAAELAAGDGGGVAAEGVEQVGPTEAGVEHGRRRRARASRGRCGRRRPAAPGSPSTGPGRPGRGRRRAARRRAARPRRRARSRAGPAAPRR